MKKNLLLLILTISFSINAQVSTTDTNPSNFNASAIGIETTASGWASTAMGAYSTASGLSSTAMGGVTTASGDHSTAMGRNTIASGNRSTAMGYDTIASDYGSLVIGQFNSSGSSVTNSATVFDTANTAFVIGNGVDSSNKSDAFKVMFSGDTYVSGSLYLGGSAITSTSAELNILDGVTATTAELNLLGGVSTIGDGILASVTENGNSGVRLSNSDAANHGDIGSNAVDLSYQSSASTTTGATGDYSTAMGYNTTSSGAYSIAMGQNSKATGNYSFASGQLSTASGTFSTAMGSFTTASGSRATAMGRNTTASADYSTSMGYYTTASGFNSASIGYYTTASGYYSTVIGQRTTASDRSSLVIGEYNLSGSTVTSSATSFNLENTAFVIGNGTGSNSRSDALVVKFNGETTLAGNLNINSDARLKANIVSLGSTLAKLLQIDGKSYTLKKDESEKQKIGLLAQDIEKVFPELVTETNDIKSVNYQGLVPVLINAMKEQDDMIRQQQKEIDELKAMVTALINN